MARYPHPPVGDDGCGCGPGVVRVEKRRVDLVASVLSELGAAPVLGFVVAPQVNIVSAGVGSQLVAHPEHQVPVPPPVDLVAELYNPQVLRPARVPAAHVAGCFGVTPRMAFDSEGGQEQAVVAVECLL